MSLTGSASRTSSKESGQTNNELDPFLKQLHQTNMTRATGVANQPFQPYGGQRVAGLSPTQQLGRSMALGAAGVQGYTPPSANYGLGGYGLGGVVSDTGAMAPAPMQPVPRPQPAPSMFEGLAPISQQGVRAYGGNPVMGAVSSFTGGDGYEGPRIDTAGAAPSQRVQARTEPDYEAFTRMNPTMEANYQRDAVPLGMTREAYGQWFQEHFDAEDGQDVPMRQVASTPALQPVAVPQATQSAVDPLAGVTFGPGAGDETLNAAIGATGAILGMRPDAVQAPVATAALGQAPNPYMPTLGAYTGDTRVMGFGGATLEAPAQFGGATLGPAAQAQAYLQGPAAQLEAAQAGPAAMLGKARGVTARESGFDRFGGASVADASLSTAERIARGDIRDLDMTDITGRIRAFSNPYEEQVVAAALGDIEGARKLAQVQNDSRMAGRRAFGSRQDFTTAEIDRAALDATGRTGAQLRSQGWQSALAAAEAEEARRLQTQGANQGVDLTVAGQNAAAGNVTAGRNQDAVNSVSALRSQLLQQAELAMSDLSARVGIANADRALQADSFSASADNDFRVRDVAARNGREDFNTGFRQQTGLTNLESIINKRTQDQQALNTFALGNTEASNNFGLARYQGDQQTGLAAQDLLGRFALGRGQFAHDAGLATMGAYNTAGLQDSGRRDALQGLNLGSANTAGQFNTSLQADRYGRDQAARNTVGLANQDAALRTGIANQSTGLQLGALGLQGAAQLGALGGQQRSHALGNAGVVSGIGQQEQAQQQQFLDYLFEQYLARQQYPFQTQQLLNQALGLVPAVIDSKTSGKKTGTELGVSATYTKG